jgi:hypothetical protein
MMAEILALSLFMRHLLWLSPFAAYPFLGWVGVFLPGMAFFCWVTALVFFCLSDLPFAVGLFAMNAEKNTMNHISTLFESLVSFLATIMFLGHECKIVIQYCLEWQEKRFDCTTDLRVSKLDTVGTG